MSDENLPVPSVNAEIVGAGRLPAFQDDLPREFPQMSAEAELVLPTEIYAPWFRAIQKWLEQAGARNNVDYRAIVSTAGTDDKKRLLFRVKWRTMTDKGVLYLNLMAQTLRMLEQETKQLGHEKPQIPHENGGKTTSL